MNLHKAWRNAILTTNYSHNETIDLANCKGVTYINSWNGNEDQYLKAKPGVQAHTYP